MKVCFTILMVFLFVRVLPLTVNGQPNQSLHKKAADSALVDAIDLYDRSIKQNSFIYNGRIYHDQYEGIRGHPYFMDDYWISGSLFIKGDLYDSLEILYEIYNDQLLLKSYNNEGRLAPIILNSQDIKYFDLHGHSFVFLEKDPAVDFSEGFYDVIYSGTVIDVLVKRKKEIDKVTWGNDLWEEFREKNIFYMKKDDAHYRIKNKGNVLKLLDEHKRELKVYIRKQNLDFRANTEEAVIRIVSFFETL